MYDAISFDITQGHKKKDFIFQNINLRMSYLATDKIHGVEIDIVNWN